MSMVIGKPAMWDVFVSYAHADDDDGLVSALVETIRKEHAAITLRPLRVFFDRDAIQTMDDWEHRILAGLKASKVTLAVVSPAYFQSQFCRREWEVFLEHELARTVPGESIAPIYAVTVPGFEDGQAAMDKWLSDLRRRQYLDLRPWWSEGTAALEREEVRLKLQALEQQVGQRIDAAEAVEGSPSTVPEHNRNFVGREEELRQLRRMLIDGRVGAITAVHGVGGIGKSALAFEYAHAFAAEYPGGRFLVTVAGATDLRIPIVNLAPQLGIELTDEERKALAAGFARVRAALEQGRPSLLLLDNLDDPGLLAPSRRAECLPHGRNVHVLVTTRVAPEQLPEVECLALDRLADEDGRKLLGKYRAPTGDEEWKAAAGIVQRLGGHALAVEVVAVHLAQNPEISFRGYLARLEAEGLGALDSAGEDPLVALSRHPVKLLGALLEPTLHGLSAEEVLVLEYAALLPPDRIAMPWLRALVADARPALDSEPKAGHPDPWARLARRLDGLRLLVRGDEPRLARMHRIVQDVVEARMAPEELDRRRTRVTDYTRQRAAHLEEAWVNRENRWEIGPLCEYAVLLMDLQSIDGASLASDIAPRMHNLGNLAEARDLMCRAIAIEEKTFEPDCSALATAYSNLALIELDLGNRAEARELMCRAIAIDEKAFEPDHPSLASGYSNLAMIEQDLGNLTEARELMCRAIAIDEKAFEPDHPTLAIRYSNLATIEHDLGNLAGSRDLMRRALTIQQKTCDPDHPDLGILYSNLATIEQRLGNLVEARELMRRAVAIDEKAFEPDHPTLAADYSNLALMEQDLGNLAEAQDLMRQAIAIWKSAFDPDHPTLAIGYSNVAMIERDLGNLTEAHELMRRAIVIGEDAFDPDHPRLARTRYKQGLVEQDLGNAAEARSLIRRAYEVQRAKLADNHPHLQASRQWLQENDPEFHTDA
jgi:tetratricopeptide (TPR) repeat protein